MHPHPAFVGLASLIENPFNELTASQDPFVTGEPNPILVRLFDRTPPTGRTNQAPAGEPRAEPLFGPLGKMPLQVSSCL
jgi:hypothetical protein